MSKDKFVSNPFDVLNQAALELARASLYFTERYRNLEFGYLGNFNDLELCWNKIQEQYKLLKSMNQEDIDSLRNVSYVVKDNNLSEMNKYLYDKFNEIPTEYSNCFPFVSEEFEKLMYGVDSEDYKRRIFLRAIADNDARFKSEVLDAEELKRVYNLKDLELEYITSYLNSKNK